MRLFTIARFAVYALIVAVGALHLASRDEAVATADAARGPGLAGRTAQGYTVDARLDGSRIVRISLGWGARCDNRESLNDQRATFAEGIGEFDRHGSRFRGLFGGPAEWADGRSYGISARVEGTERGGEAHGTAALTASYVDRGRQVICDSGTIQWSVRP